MLHNFKPSPKTKMSEKRYTVWADSDSRVYCHKYFDKFDEADTFASRFVHQFDGTDAERVIVHLEDNEADETIGTYENINKCDFPQR